MKLNYWMYYTTFDKSLLYQINSHYSLFQYEKNRDLYRYGSKKRQEVKYAFGYKDLVEDHHIIPKEFEDHLFIRDIGFDVGCSRNIRIMPNHYGYTKLNLSNGLIHHNGHIQYNQYVKSQLNELYKTTNFEESKYKFMLFFWYLETQLDNGTLPW